ncbi:metallophosphoesterase [Stieleria sp. TO1_6]|uniref:metallophosphoesterase family protein n=1 Tax=Stieleria tagensis TaxID=2956795 RepID=UPI00209A9EBC|nr:metallophosphoesterase family protein [Stieleria tagensis]MCO8122197.1 metallophosphoesterase [Stieleria tagensis]
MGNKKKRDPYQPDYRGKRWIEVDLPTQSCDWSTGGEQSIVTDRDNVNDLVEVLGNFQAGKKWQWPKRQLYFISDLHADPDAFNASLVASSGVSQFGSGHRDFKLTSSGRKARFVIGGDCFDKGPDNLGLLRAVRHLKDQGARLTLLAGNHDIRLLFGMRVVGAEKEVRNEHFFVRSGQKIIPLLREIWEVYLAGKTKTKDLPNVATCRQRLYPRASWFDEFPKIKGGDILPSQFERELQRIAKKMDRFESLCGDAGLDLRQVYAATQQWKALFLKRRGEFRWFYNDMQLCYRSGSFLFVHAGVDDEVASILARDGVAQLNRAFQTSVRLAPFDFYYGALCNTIRTKYRAVDRPFTAKGAKQLRKAGITAIVHGHRNLHHGQRLSLRQSQLNFECDTSLDRHTRKVENVVGRGASVTIVHPDGYLLGVSSDYPKIKVFHPRQTLDELRTKSSSARK